jgi:uncharacterized protein
MLPMKARQIIYAIVLSGLCMTSAWAQTEPGFPVHTGQVVDAANLLTESMKTVIGSRIDRLRSDTGAHLVIVTVPSLQGYDIADYGTRLGNYWGVGDADEDNGILLIVASNERKVRIAVGYGLEDNLTDRICNDIIQIRFFHHSGTIGTA